MKNIGDSLTTELPLEMDGWGWQKRGRERKRSNQMKGWRNGCSGGKMARYRRAHFLCRPLVMYSWNGKGRMDGGAEGSNVGEGGSGVEAGEWWTVGLSHQGCLLTCATKRDIHHTGRRQYFTQLHRRRNTPLTCWAHTHKRAQWSQPGATVHHPENSIKPSSVERCSTGPF